MHVVSPAPRGLAGAQTQRAAMRSDNRTGFKGVHAQDGRWRARITYRGRQLSLGLHDTPEDAARAYDKAACDLYGPGAWMNATHRPGGVQ